MNKLKSELKLAIIGGGPIGLFLSIKLAQLGYSVGVFEKKSWPVDKVCGQGIMPTGVKLLKEIGLDIDDKNSFPLKNIIYTDLINDKLTMTGRLLGEGVGIERSQLSKLLFLKASSFKNINLVENYSFDIANEKNKYDYLFACDGLHSQTRKQLNKEKVFSRELNRLGARLHYEQAPWQKGVCVFWSDRCEAYVTPVGESKVEVAYLWYEDAIDKGANLEERLLEKFPLLSKKLDQTKNQNDFKAYGPFKSKSSVVNEKKVFFIGDAYFFLDGITGEGLALGFKSADYIAKHFERFYFFNILKIKLMYLKYSFFVKLALSLSRNPALRRLIFKALGKNSFCFNTLLRLNDL